jgi:hypothetical protein
MFPRQTKRTDTGSSEDVDIVPACDSAVAFLAVMVALVRQARASENKWHTKFALHIYFV